MKFKVEIIRGVNKGRVLVMDEEKAVAFVEENKVRILQVFTNDAPPEETPGFVEVSTEVSGSIETPAEYTPPAEGDDLEDEERCDATTAKGERCKKPRIIDAKCSIHASLVKE